MCVVQESSKNKGGSRAAATSEMERFVIIVNGWKPLTIITKRAILDVAAVLDASQKKLFLPVSREYGPLQQFSLIKKTCNNWADLHIDTSQS